MPSPEELDEDDAEAGVSHWVRGVDGDTPESDRGEFVLLLRECGLENVWQLSLTRPGINTATRTATIATYTELLESLPLVLGEFLRQRVLGFLRFRSLRLLVLGLLT